MSGFRRWLTLLPSPQRHFAAATLYICSGAAIPGRAAKARRGAKMATSETVLTRRIIEAPCEAVRPQRSTSTSGRERTTERTFLVGLNSTFCLRVPERLPGRWARRLELRSRVLGKHAEGDVDCLIRKGVRSDVADVAIKPMATVVRSRNLVDIDGSANEIHALHREHDVAELRVRFAGEAKQQWVASQVAATGQYGKLLGS